MMLLSGLMVGHAYWYRYVHKLIKIVSRTPDLSTACSIAFATSCPTFMVVSCAEVVIAYFY
jgi:hypothetical protein